MLRLKTKSLPLAAILTLFCAGVSLVTASSERLAESSTKEANASEIGNSLPPCATASSTNSCSLVPGGQADDGSLYAGTLWLAPPNNLPATIKAHDSYFQIGKLPLSRSKCAPGATVEARLVLRLPPFDATKSKTDAMAVQKNTAGIMADSNPLAVDKSGKTRRCVLAGVKEGASAAEAAAGAKEAAESPTTSQFSEAKCTECNSLTKSGENYVACPSVPNVWYVDRLPLKVPTAEAGWCDDDGRSKDGGSREARPADDFNVRMDNFATFVLNAGSSVDVALFDVVERSTGAGAPSA